MIQLSALARPAARSTAASLRAPILVLPPEVADRIAAGEVVERPASVVRELVDNALDAGAREVRIELRGGGLELIRVSDDGWGIPPDEIELAFQRHATSKIRTLDDLERLGSLGFRGEALPSIAAVGEVSIVSRAESHSVGALVVVQGGLMVRRGQVARQPGTTVTVRQLFQHVPARLKFLPTSRAETLLVGHLVRRYALAHPEVRLSLVLDGRLSFRSGGAGRLEAALSEVYGAAVAGAMLRLPERKIDAARIAGWIGGRSITRPGRQHLTVVINRRLATSRSLLVALEAAYRPLLPRGRHPIAVLALEVPPAELDPNVHPAKTEVRLSREQEVAEALAEAVRETLARMPARPTAGVQYGLPASQYRLPSPSHPVAEASGRGWGRAEENPEALETGLPRLRVVAQVQQSLVLAEGERGMFLIDQHRAHERVIYERLLRAERGQPEGQALLEPVVLELKPHQAVLLQERRAALEALGFNCQRFGGRDFLVRAVPAVPAQGSLATHLQALVEEAASEDEGWRERLLASLACRAALRRNQPMSEAEMRALVRDLADASAPAVCPHGSPLILHLSGSFLERQFGW